MSRSANPPTRSVARWAATIVVSLQCWSVMIWMLIGGLMFGWGPQEYGFALVVFLAGAAVLGCQVVAVFRRQWIGSWMAAAVVGVLLLVPGVCAASTLPLALIGLAINGEPERGVFWVIALEGLWALAVLFAGSVMLWWAIRLYRWRVLRLSPCPRPLRRPMMTESTPEARL